MQRVVCQANHARRRALRCCKLPGVLQPCTPQAGTGHGHFLRTRSRSPAPRNGSSAVSSVGRRHALRPAGTIRLTVRTAQARKAPRFCGPCTTLTLATRRGSPHLAQVPIGRERVRVTLECLARGQTCACTPIRPTEGTGPYALHTPFGSRVSLDCCCSRDRRTWRKRGAAQRRRRRSTFP